MPIDLSEVGAFPSAPSSRGIEARFGVYLPGIDPNTYQLLVRVIHRDDRFVPEIQPMDFALSPVLDHPLQLWEARVSVPLKPQTNFGKPGPYLYRYQLRWKTPPPGTSALVTRWFTDPFARATDDVGQLSAFTTPGAARDFVWSDGAWKTPGLDERIVYELHVEEFNGSFAGVIDRLPYLEGLGVTCLELMPVTSLKLDFDWGYGPLHYFAPNERWGGSRGLKALIDACHSAGIAVITDMVYQHVDWAFPYHLVYADAGLHSPMIGQEGPFGPEIDYTQEFARDYVATVNKYWLTEYHVDGFRYDEVTDLYDGPTGSKYAKIAYDTYNESFKIPRFTPSGGNAGGEYSRIIQVPEALNRPQEILQATYSNGTWQDGFLNKAQDMAARGYVDDGFVHLLDASFCGYPSTKTVQDALGKPVDMPVTPFQYLNSHDHSDLIAFVGGWPGDAPFADRSRSYKLQPFVIALYSCEGTPMLWQGQEFADNYVLPSGGDARVHFRRDVHWEYFYDEAGARLIRLHRRLGKIRHAHPALRSRESFYDNVNSRPTDGIVVYQRRSAAAGQIAVVVLNFSDQQRTISVPFPDVGTYVEMLDDDVRANPLTIPVLNPNQFIAVDVPSNYGYLFVKG